jgi:protein tyrosine phosphatase (PTP) superfamily phosphohydrolase (DUF442 family)
MIIRRRIKRFAIAVGLLVALTGASVGGFYGYLRLSGNLGVVEPGVCYRSGQLSGTALDEVVTADSIHSILNLRGASPGAQWYKTELAVSASRHVEHFDYALSASRFVTPAQDEEILHIIATAPKPILIHCQAGADRTGLVSALYRYAHGASATAAAHELSLRHGHFPYLWSHTDAMDSSFSVYVQTSPRNPSVGLRPSTTAQP